MLRVVIDTNVVVKGLFISGSKHDRVVRLFKDEKLRVYYSMEMVNELLGVVSYPRVRKSFEVDDETVREYADFLSNFGQIVVPEETKKCRDIKDNVVLGTAMAGAEFGLTYLVTEDDDLLALKGEIENVEVVMPGELMAVAEEV